MNADGSRQTNISNNPTFDHGPTWSPDGTKIAFATGRGNNGQNQIYVMNADGTGQTNISNSPSNDFSPAWSPDGTKIAFVRDVSGGSENTEIFVMNAGDGSGQTRLTNNPNSEQPSWSPDGTKIAFWGVRPNPGGAAVAEIYVMNADGTNEVRITNNRCCVANTDPDWGPAAGTSP